MGVCLERRFNRTGLSGLVVVAALAQMVLSGAAVAQLTADDIAALRARGEAEGWTFTVGENSATKYSLDELCGYKEAPDWQDGARFDPMGSSRSLPTSYDWRDETGCPPVRNQGGCGSCWAFGSVGALECNILIKDGVVVDLSEQWLVSCTDAGNCGGGWWAHDYHEFLTDSCGDTGAVPEEDFPYAAADLPCDCPYRHSHFIDGWAFVGGVGVPEIAQVKQAIMDYGPVTITVAVDDSFQAYDGGVFNHCSCDDLNHMVVLVGWDDNQGPSGVWFLRNSWGGGWGEGGYMRIPYGCAMVANRATYVDYPGQIPFAISLPDGAPNLLSPSDPTPVTVYIDELGGDHYLEGSGQIYYRYDGGDWLTAPLALLEGDLYQGFLPPGTCDATPEFYVSAEGEVYGVVTDPPGAPAETYTAGIGLPVNVLEDSFETDIGWTVENDAGLSDGAWERGVPASDGVRGDPTSDYDGSGQCYLTDNVAGNSDVDGGTTSLITPAIDMSAMVDPFVGYARWYSNVGGERPEEDVFVAWISNDNGENWVELETVGPAGAEVHGGWYVKDFRVASYVGPTAEVKVRFDASDLINGSVVEAAVDAFYVSDVVCGGVAPGLAAPPHDAPKNRYISFTPNNGGFPVAFHVELVGSTIFREAAGPVGWVGEPDENGIARLVDELYLSTDWPSVVHVGDCAIAPAASYQVRASLTGSDLSDPFDVSTVPQPEPMIWGDVVGAFGETSWAAPNGVVNFNDVQAAVQMFISAPTAPPLTWVDMGAEVPDKVVNFGDVQWIVLGFQGADYPFANPLMCP